MLGVIVVMASQESEVRILKGILFEFAILHMLFANGFRKILLDSSKKNSDARAVMSRGNFIELKGRGGWHQIDCPCDLNYSSPFMFPIRLLGEVKFTQTKVSKRVVESYIGVLKDIQENYFVANPDLVIDSKQNRFLEVGCIFSANGFTSQAENLAYTHGIRTISYENNIVVDRIKLSIERLVKDNVDPSNVTNAGRLLLTELNRFFGFAYSFDHIYPIYSKRVDSFLNYSLRRVLIGNYEKNLINLLDSIGSIKDSFIATTPEGLLLHFVGEQEFPEELFLGSDYAQYRIHIHEYKEKKDSYAYYLAFSGDSGLQRKFYFSPPDVLKNAIDQNWDKVLDVKKRFLYKLVVHKTINRLHRTLVLELDYEWVVKKAEASMS